MNETTPTYREKGRAVFLAAIMVLSMVAGVAVFAAPAAAEADGVDASVNQGTATITVDHADGDNPVGIVISDDDSYNESDIFRSNESASGTTTTFDVDVSGLGPGSYTVFAAANNDSEGEPVAEPEIGQNLTFDSSWANTDAVSSLNASNASYQVNSVNDISGNPGQQVTIEATIENTGDLTGNQTIETNDTDAFNGSVTLEENLQLAGNETTTVTATAELNASVDGSQVNEFDYNVTTDNDTDGEVGSVIISDNGFIQGDVRDSNNNEIENADVTITNERTGEEFTTQTDETGAFTQGVPGGDNYSIEVDQEGFESFSTTREVNPGGTERIDVTLVRIITPDEIEVTNVDPSDSVDVGTSVNVTVNVTSADFAGASQQQPLEDTPVEAGVASDNTGSVDGANAINIDNGATNVTKNTDADGLATFTISVDPDTVFESIEEVVQTTIRFEATEGDNVDTTQDLEFQGEPPSGDGVLQGDVSIVDEDVQLGVGPENADSASDINVHAARLDRMLENTVEQSVAAGDTDFARVVIRNTSSGEVVDTLDVQTDYLFQGDGVAVNQNLSIEGTGFNAENTSATGAGNFTVHVLEPSDALADDETYELQVSSDGNFSSSDTTPFTAPNNLTFDGIADRYSDVAAQPTDTGGDYNLQNLFTDGENGTDYVVIAGDGNPAVGFANGQAYDVVTVYQSGSSTDTTPFTPLNVQEVEIQADSVNVTNVGTHPPLSETGGAPDFDEVDAFGDQSDDFRQEVPRDGETIDVINLETFVEEDGTLVGDEVTVSYEVTDGSFDGTFPNLSVGGAVTNVGPDGESITVDTSTVEGDVGDGEAFVFLVTDEAGLNEDANVTINVEMENAADTDATDKEFVGVLDQDYQSGSITGVVTNEDDEPVDADIFVTELRDEDAGISITFEPDDPAQLDTFTATVFDDDIPANGDVVESVELTAAEMEEFNFSAFDSDLSLAQNESNFELLAERGEDRTTLSPVPAVAADPGVSLALTGVDTVTNETGTSVSTAIEVDRTSTASVVIEGAEPADSGSSLSEYNTGENGEVTAEGLNMAFDDWQAGDLTPEELQLVFEAWQSGEPV